MSYTRIDFGKELKEKIKNKDTRDFIGKWSYTIYFKHMLEIDDSFKSFLMDLNAMEDGPEFELSYEELDKIADRLIAGEDVQL